MKRLRIHKKTYQFEETIRLVEQHGKDARIHLDNKHYLIDGWRNVNQELVELTLREIS